MIQCNICGGRNSELHLTLNREGKDWNIYKCNYCQTQFVYPVPSEDEIKKMYGDYYTSKDGIAMLQPNYGRLSFPRQWGIIRKLSDEKFVRILDYGCSGGQFLKQVQMGITWGVEINETARKVAIKNYVNAVGSIEELATQIESALPSESYFDIIVMFATIEHLVDPRGTVEKLSKMLKNGGLFAIMTGDVSSVKARVKGKDWELYAPSGHLYYFTADSLDCMMESLGYKKVKHLYTDGGTTQIPFMPLNLVLRVGLEVLFRIPYLNRLPLWDTYYGYYRKERT